MATQFKHLQLRRATAFDWSFDNPVLLQGEVGWETDTNKVKIGDGTTVWNSLTYFAGEGGGGGGGCVTCDANGNVHGGVDSIVSPTFFDNSVILGAEAGRYQLDVYGAVYIGWRAGANSAGAIEDVMIGSEAGGESPNNGPNESFGNVTVGAYAFGAITDGGQNTIIGSFAGENLESGWLNTLIGTNAGWSLTTGENNTCIGTDSGLSIETGTGNTIIGYGVGDNIVTGNYNILIGTEWQSPSADGSYRLMIEGSDSMPFSTTPGLIYGEFDTRLLRFHNSSFAVRYQNASFTTDSFDSFRVDGSTTAGHTRMLVYDVDNGTLERVTVGAADSGGAGFKVLRIPN